MIWDQRLQRPPLRIRQIARIAVALLAIRLQEFAQPSPRPPLQGLTRTYHELIMVGFPKIVLPDPRRCRTLPPIRLIRPACFLLLESRKINYLVLIPFRLARATHAGGSPREARATREAGRAASATPSG